MKGHIQKRNGRYYMVLEQERDFDPETGEPIRNRVGGGSYRTREEAREALRDALDASRKGWRGPSRVTLGAYLTDEWLPGVSMELAPTTAALYRTLMTAYVIPRLGGRRLDAITPADLTTMYAELLREGGRGGKALAPKTVRHVHTTIRRALADAEKARHISWNPAAAAKSPRVGPSREPTAWTAEQLRGFLAHIEGDRLEAMWLLGAVTGMRRSELLGLSWSDVDLAESELTIRRAWVSYGKVRTLKEPKSAASRRTLPVDPRAVAALRRFKKAQAAERLAAGEAYNASDLIFVDELGDPFPPERISTTFRRLVKGAGLPPLTLHGLRHTFATVGLDEGIDVLYLAEVLGHSSPAITQAIYQHTRPERKAEAVARIGAAIFG